MFIINYYYLERNKLSDTGRDQRYWLGYLSALIWDQSAMIVTLLQRLVREISTDSIIRLPCKEER